MGSARRILIDCTIILGVGLVLALVGPFGSFGAPFALRLIYWLALSYAGYFLYFPTMRAASHFAPRLDLPEWSLWAAASIVASVPMSVIAWAANLIWHPARQLTLEQWIAHYFNVAVLGGLVCALFWFIRQRRLASGAPVPEPEAPTEEPGLPRLIERLPPHLRAAPIALEMEDHYVRVHTIHGSSLLLMRMRDAVAELDGMPGALVHRSWWVAREAVTGTRREGRNVRLLLAGGIEAPVARA